MESAHQDAHGLSAMCCGQGQRYSSSLQRPGPCLLLHGGGGQASSKNKPGPTSTGRECLCGDSPTRLPGGCPPRASWGSAILQQLQVRFPLWPAPPVGPAEGLRQVRCRLWGQTGGEGCMVWISKSPEFRTRAVTWLWQTGRSSQAHSCGPAWGTWPSPGPLCGVSLWDAPAAPAPDRTIPR